MYATVYILYKKLLFFRLDLTAANREIAEDKHSSSVDSFESFTALSLLPTGRQKSRSVIKSASTSGLSLVIPTGDFSCMY
jgi:microtubule-associated serine/threonine kinase